MPDDGDRQRKLVGEVVSVDRLDVELIAYGAG